MENLSKDFMYSFRNSDDMCKHKTAWYIRSFGISTRNLFHSQQRKQWMALFTSDSSFHFSKSYFWSFCIAIIIKEERKYFCEWWPNSCYWSRIYINTNFFMFISLICFDFMSLLFYVKTTFCLLFLSVNIQEIFSCLLI